MSQPAQTRLAAAFIAVAATCLLPVGARADYTVERVVSGLTQPMFVTQAPGDNNHLYIVERTDGGSSLGRVMKYDQISKTSSTFLDLTGTTVSDGGLLSMTFHPDFDTNGLFYTVSNANRINGLDEWQVVNGAPVMQRRLYEYENLDNVFHTLNQAHFQPGGSADALYVLGGDGGTQANSGNFDAALIEDPDSPFGKLLRIDLSANFATPAGGASHAGVELVASGFRNPYRSGFDRTTGDFYVADVGFNAVEEVDFIPASHFANAAATPLDFGWTDREGTIATIANNAGGPGSPGDVNPVFEYAHNGSVPLAHDSVFNGGSITGGYVYRGPVAELQGRYFFADFTDHVIYSGEFDTSTAPSNYDGDNFTNIQRHDIEFENLLNDGTHLSYITSFGEDNAGNLYVVKFGDSFFPGAGQGEIFRIAAVAGSPVQVTIDRTTGEITLLNVTDEAVDVQSVTISSALGAIDTAELTPITGLRDVNGDMTVDDNDAWTITSNTTSLFSEQTTGDAGQIAALSQLALSGPDGWVRSPDEDIVVTLLDGAGAIIDAEVSFVGNGGAAFDFADLDFDGQLDRDDFVLLAQFAHTDLSGLSVAQAYGAGDLNSDGQNDYDDFLLFKSAFISANGEAAFAALGAVPAPGSALLLCAAAPLALSRRIWSQKSPPESH